MTPNTTFTKNQLLEMVYADQKDYIAEVGLREFECLVALVKDGTISNIQQLIDHGVEINS